MPSILLVEEAMQFVRAGEITLLDAAVGSKILDMVHKEKGYSWPSQETIAEMLGTNRVTVSRSVKKLEKKELLTIEKTNTMPPRNLYRPGKKWVVNDATGAVDANNGRTVIDKLMSKDACEVLLAWSPGAIWIKDEHLSDMKKVGEVIESTISEQGSEAVLKRVRLLRELCTEACQEGKAKYVPSWGKFFSTSSKYNYSADILKIWAAHDGILDRKHPLFETLLGGRDSGLEAQAIVSIWERATTSGASIMEVEAAFRGREGAKVQKIHALAKSLTDAIFKAGVYHISKAMKTPLIWGPEDKMLPQLANLPKK